MSTITLKDFCINTVVVSGTLICLDTIYTDTKDKEIQFKQHEMGKEEIVYGNDMWSFFVCERNGVEFLYIRRKKYQETPRGLDESIDIGRYITKFKQMCNEANELYKHLKNNTITNQDEKIYIKIHDKIWKMSVSNGKINVARTRNVKKGVELIQPNQLKAAKNRMCALGSLQIPTSLKYYRLYSSLILPEGLSFESDDEDMLSKSFVSSRICVPAMLENSNDDLMVLMDDCKVLWKYCTKNMTSEQKYDFAREMGLKAIHNT